MKHIFKSLRALVGALSFVAHVAVYAGSLTPGTSVVTGSAIGQVAASQPANRNLIRNSADPAGSNDTAQKFGVNGAATITASPTNQWDAGFLPIVMQGTNSNDYINAVVESYTASTSNNFTFSAQFTTNSGFSGITNASNAVKIYICYQIAGNPCGGPNTKEQTLTFNPASGQIISSTGNIASVNVQLFSTQISSQSGSVTQPPLPVLGVQFSSGALGALYTLAQINIYPNINGGGAKQVIAGGFQLESGSSATAYMPTGAELWNSRYLGLLPKQQITSGPAFTSAAFTGNGVFEPFSQANTVIYTIPGQTYYLQGSCARATPYTHYGVVNGTTVSYYVGSGTVTIATCNNAQGDQIVMPGNTSVNAPYEATITAPAAVGPTIVTFTYNGLGVWVATSTNTGYYASSNVLPAAGGAGTVLRSNSTAWVASQMTYPDLIAANNIAFATAANTLGSSTNLTWNGTTLGVGGSITPSQTGGIVGTTTNNNANAGSVGEFVESNATVSVASASITNVTSITLTAGDWDIAAGLFYNNNVSIGRLILFVSTTTASSAGTTFGTSYVTGAVDPISQSGSAVTPRYRVQPTGTTTYYLNGQLGAGGPSNTTGYISARRVR